MGKPIFSAAAAAVQVGRCTPSSLGDRCVHWQRSSVTVGVLRAQHTVDEAIQLQGPDTSCIVRSLLAEVGAWDEACRWLEDWDFFTRSLLRHSTAVHWVPSSRTPPNWWSTRPKP